LWLGFKEPKSKRERPASIRAAVFSCIGEILAESRMRRIEDGAAAVLLQAKIPDQVELLPKVAAPARAPR
jgi:hypothetical protein